MNGKSIEDRVYAALVADDTGRGIIGQAHSLTGSGRPVGERELDLVDWGVVYGMCIALVREEDAWASWEYCAERAKHIARGVYARWGNDALVAA